MSDEQTQKQIAEEMGVSEARISQIINEKLNQLLKERVQAEEELEIDLDNPTEAEIKAETEDIEYKCPNCEYKTNKQFNNCPKCGIELTWE